jgi:hypothetical protein
MRKESGAEKKTASKEAIAKEIVKQFNFEDEGAAVIYKRGFIDFARYVQAGGVFAEIKEMMTTNKLPIAMRPAKRTKRQPLRY